MTSQQATLALQMTLPAVQQEFETTARVMAAVPDDQSSYRPHEKNMTALELVQHMAASDIWFLESIINGEFKDPDGGEITSLSSASQVLDVYRNKLPKLIDALSNLSGEHLARQVKFYNLEHPLVAFLNFMLSHSIHHRGQLSVYLRPMGAKVPSIYGSSADEPMTMTA